MTTDRNKVKEELLFKLGRLFGPIEALITRETDVTSDERTRVLARYCAEFNHLITEFHHFSTSERGHSYQSQYTEFRRALFGFARQAEQDSTQIEIILESVLSRAKHALRSIPVSQESVIFEINTPFSTYCKLKTLCNLAQTSITFVDRFLDQSIFYRYLQDVSDDVVVTLIGPKSVLNDAFLDISSLFARERGSDKYSFVSVPFRDIHDRWLQADNELYQLGNSSANAAMINDFTLSPIKATEENLRKITDKIASGTQQYGSAQTNHPKRVSDLL